MKSMYRLIKIIASFSLSTAILLSVPTCPVLALVNGTDTNPVAFSDEPELLEGQTSGVEGFVTRLYEIALGRTPDPAGLANWSEQLKSRRATGIQVAFGFVFSPEFLAKNLSSAEYVECLYKMLLGRASDIGGKQNWVNTLNNGASREVVFAGFANSIEFRGICDSYGITQGFFVPGVPVGTSSAITDFVQRLYLICLNRTGENEGVSNWTRLLLEGSATGSGVAYGFVFSTEYLDKKPSAKDFVTMLYRTFLGREPDQTGLDHWVSNIESGGSMESVFAGFANSQEFTDICSRYGISRGTYTPPPPESSHFIGFNLYSFTVNGQSITIGESADVLISRFGSPDRIDPTEYPWNFYVYNSDYAHLFMIAVQEGKVVGWFTDASDMEYMGLTKDSTGADVKAKFPAYDYASEQMEDCLVDNKYSLQFSLRPLKPGEKVEDIKSSYRIILTSENQLDTMLFLPQQPKTKTITAEIYRAYELEVFDTENSFRSNEGYSILSWSDLGAKAARLHSEDMAANNYFSHKSQNGDTMIDRLRKQGVTGLYPSGENIGAGYRDPFSMIFGWKTSSGHLVNLLGRDYTFLGVGLAYKDTSSYKYYWTQDFHV